jgi:hypothetical protein
MHCGFVLLVSLFVLAEGTDDLQIVTVWRLHLVSMLLTKLIKKFNVAILVLVKVDLSIASCASCNRTCYRCLCYKSYYVYQPIHVNAVPGTAGQRRDAHQMRKRSARGVRPPRSQQSMLILNA